MVTTSAASRSGPAGYATEDSGVRSARVLASQNQVLSRLPAVTTRFFARLAEAYPAAQEAIRAAPAVASSELQAALREVIALRGGQPGAREALTLLGQRHVAFGLRGPHYRLINEILVRVVAEQIGDDWDAALECEWAATLSQGAAVMIEGGSLPQ